VLLCDEATSALDPETTKSILGLLKDINRQLGLTVVLITHEMQAIKEICDRVAVLDHGRIVEQGRVFDVFTSPAAGVTRAFAPSARWTDGSRSCSTSSRRTCARRARRRA